MRDGQEREEEGRDQDKRHLGYRAQRHCRLIECGESTRRQDTCADRGDKINQPQDMPPDKAVACGEARAFQQGEQNAGGGDRHCDIAETRWLSEEARQRVPHMQEDEGKPHRSPSMDNGEDP